MNEPSNDQPQTETIQKDTPESTASVSSSAQQTTSVVGGGDQKKKMFAALIAVALIVVGGVAYGVYAYVTNTPDYLLSKSFEQFGQQTAVAAKFTLVSGAPGSRTTLVGDVAARGESGTKNGEAAIGIGSGGSRITISARVIDGMAYVRFGDLANFGNLSKSLSANPNPYTTSADFKAGLMRVNGKWFSLTKEEAATFAQNFGASSSINGAVQVEDIQKAFTIYGKHPFFKADKILADETIDNVASAHFTLKIDKPAYRAFMNDLKAANLETIKVTDDDIKNADKDADDFAKNSPVDVWVARNSKKLKQVKVADTSKGDDSTITITFITDLPKFEKLEKPADAKPFSSFLTTLIGEPTAPLSFE